MCNIPSSFITGNKIDGKMLLKLSRFDLKDLSPDDFPARKKLWDILSDIVCSTIDFEALCTI